MTPGRCGIALILVFGVGACTLPDALRLRTAAQVYMLDVARHQSTQVLRTERKPKILVSVPQAWPGFASVDIAYTREPYRIEYYAYSEWADVPAQMIGPLLAKALQDSGHFSAVVALGTGVPADLRLDTEIVKLQQEFGVSPSIGRVVLRVQLIDLASARVLGTRTIEASAPAPTDDPAGAVLAMNHALLIVFDQILAYCEELAAAPGNHKS